VKGGVSRKMGEDNCIRFSGTKLMQQ